VYQSLHVDCCVRILQSLDLTVNRVIMKLFKSSNIAIILSNNADISFMPSYHLYSFKDVIGSSFVNATNDNVHLSLKLLLLCVLYCVLVEAIFVIVTSRGLCSVVKVQT